tara:strand:+ start:3839 stop:4249 length:411 start_codon:yes stop_codon:yes gene_type:complete
MAKWINFPVVGGVTNGAGLTPAPGMDGDNLLLADSIISVSVDTSAAIVATINLAGGAGVTICTVICSTSPTATDAPDANVPASADYGNKVKAAIIRAITANPGGVKSTCGLPQDQADVTAAYDPALKVYWRSFLVS